MLRRSPAARPSHPTSRQRGAGPGAASQALRPCPEADVTEGGGRVGQSLLLHFGIVGARVLVGADVAAVVHDVLPPALPLAFARLIEALLV